MGGLVRLLALPFASGKLARSGAIFDGTALPDIAILVFVIVFPLFCQIVGRGPSFTGMRHFLFVVPPITALAGIGIHAGLRLVEARGRALGMAALAAVIWPAFWVDATALVRLHPYEYLFYNSVVGGLPGASRRYETDYWVNIMPAAVKDLEAYLDEKDRQAGRLVPSLYTVGVCGERVSFENEATAALQWTARLGQRRLLHRAHPHELRSRSRRRHRRHRRAVRRADRLCEGPPRHREAADGDRGLTAGGGCGQSKRELTSSPIPFAEGAVTHQPVDPFEIRGSETFSQLHQVHAEERAVTDPARTGRREETFQIFPPAFLLSSRHR